MSELSAQNLTGARMLARNTIYNLVGQGAPALVVIITVPMLIRGLGTDRFGILTLAWMILGYFSIFDLGLGRALMTVVAERIGVRREHDIPASVWTSLAIMAALGCTGALFVAALSPVLVHRVLKIPQALQAETLKSFYLLAFSIPVVVTTAALRGVLEAHQRFGLVNAVRIPLTLFTYAGPLIVLPFSQSLFWVVVVLTAGRMLALGVHFWLCFRVVPGLRRERTFSRVTARELLHLGWWMTISNVVSPMMVSLDRFLIGTLVSVTAVAYYTTPYEVVTKLWIVSGAFIGVLFPAFSTTFVQDREKTARLFNHGFGYVFIAMFPLTLLLILFAKEGLSFWLNAEFALHSTRIMQWLAAGVFVNSLAQIPFSLVQGSGRPDITAKLHLVQLLPYVTVAWILIQRIGIEGAAIVWVARVAVDTIVFFAAAHRILPESATRSKLHVELIAGSLCVFTAAAFVPSIVSKIFFSMTFIILYLLVSWSVMLRSEDKIFIRKVFGLRPAQGVES